VRSLDALYFLQQAGFKKVKSLHGGINAYARQVDPSIPTY
jgi:rhodanese-related sulfurtransferase